MIHRTKKEEVNDYFANPAMNQSKFKKIITARTDYLDNLSKTDNQLYYEEKGHLIVGSGVDCLLSTPEDFDNIFFYKEIEKPSDNIMALAHIVLDSYKEDQVIDIESDDFKKRTHEKLANIKFYKERAKERWQDDSRIKTITDKGYFKYIEGIREARGKQIIDIGEKQTIYAIYNSLINNPTTSELFKDKPNCDIYFQKPIYFTYRGIRCKAMLDRIEFNHKNRTIQYDEIKTMYDKTSNFNFPLKQFRYDIQIGWYGIPVVENIINSHTGRYKNYELLPPRFIVESTTSVGTPRLFTCTEEILHMSKYGKPALHTEFIVMNLVL